LTIPAFSTLSFKYTEFEVEDGAQCWDGLLVDGVQHCGEDIEGTAGAYASNTNALNGLVVKTGEIAFFADDVNSGFKGMKICFTPPSPAATPSEPPPLSEYTFTAQASSVNANDGKDTTEKIMNVLKDAGQILTTADVKAGDTVSIVADTGGNGRRRLKVVVDEVYTFTSSGKWKKTQNADGTPVTTGTDSDSSGDDSDNDGIPGMSDSADDAYTTKSASE